MTFYPFHIKVVNITEESRRIPIFRAHNAVEHLPVLFFWRTLSGELSSDVRGRKVEGIKVENI